MKLFYKIILLLFGFSFSLSVTSQNLIGPITINVPNNLPANTADWATAIPPVMLIAQAKLQNGKLPPQVEQSRVLVGIKSGGNVVCASYTQQTAPASNFTNATKSWTGAAFTDLLGKDCILKPGTYELCVKFISSSMAAANIVIGEACKSFTIEDKQQQQYTPPQNILPADNKIFTEQEVKAPITFRWTSLSPKPQQAITYRLKVWQLMQGQSGAQAMRTNQPIVIKDVENITQAVEKITFPPNHQINIWNVEAFNKDAATGQEKSLGTSQPTTFSVNAAGCGTNTDNVKVDCGPIIQGKQTYIIAVTFNNIVPAAGGQQCTTLMNTITSSTGIITALATLPVTIPIGGSSPTVTFNYTPSVSTATTASFMYQGVWNDGFSNTSNFGNTNVLLPNCNNCNCGQWGPIKVGNNSFICGNKIKWNCNTDFNFSTSYTCNPNSSNCSAKINWKVENGGVIKTGTASAALTDFFTPTTTGDYKVTLEATCNGKQCPPCIFIVHVENCPPPTIDCCKGSSWGDKIVIDKNGISKPLPKCGTNLGLLECGTVKKLKNCYNCNPNCINTTAQIKYEILDAVTNMPYSGFTALQVASCSIVNITLPVISGSWYLKITAICDINNCDSCNYYFQTQCQPNPIDCCKGSYWKPQPKIYNAAGTVVETLNCPQTNFSLLINAGKNNCNETYTIKNGAYVCASANCVSRVDYSLVNTATNAVVLSGSNSISITSALSNGNYVMNVYAICGTDTCSRCAFQVRKDCPQNQKPCCQDGKWLTKYYSISAPLIKTMPMAVDCGGNYNVDFIAGGSITFNADYLCNPALGNCVKQVFVSVKKPGTSFSVYQPVSYSMPLSEAGTYNVCYYAKCGTDTCDSCCFTITIKEKKDCCKGAFWINKSIDWSNIIDKNPAAKTAPIPSGPVTLPATSINIGDCNVSYKLSLGGTYTFNADYNCALKDCPKNVKVKIKGLTSSTLDGLYTAPIAKTFTVAGNYMITYYAYCGDQICDSCVFTIGFDKNCCLNSKWNSANYQIINKKPDGSWIWEPGIFPIGNSIPTLKADLGIDISALDFQCAKGCTPQYIVRKINLSTGGLTEPDETLALGQTTTSIYAKPFAQMVIITPTCDGQKCTPLMFRVECLHKDCVPPCTPGNKILNFSTGQDGSGGQIPLGFSDPFWQTGTSQTAYVPSWNYIPGVSILLPPAGEKTTDYTFKRCFYICEPTTINFSGVFRVDNWVTSFNLTMAGSTTPLWTYGPIPSTNPQCYANNSFSGSVVLLAKGQYCFNFSFHNQIDAPQTTSYCGLALSGTMSSTLPVLSNTQIECCPSSTSGHGNSAGSVGEAGHVSGLNLQTDTCGSWGPVYYYGNGEAPNSHLVTNDTIYQTCNSGVTFTYSYTCTNPGCVASISGIYIRPWGTIYSSANPSYNSNSEGPIILTASCCGINCGTKNLFLKILPCAGAKKPASNGNEIIVGGKKLEAGSSIVKGPIKFFNYKSDFVIDAPEICNDLGVKSITIKKGVYEVNRSNPNKGGVIELTLATSIAANKIFSERPRHFEGTNPKGLNCEGPGSACFYKSGNAGAAKGQGFTLTPIIINGVCSTLVIQYDKGGTPADPGF